MRTRCVRVTVVGAARMESGYPVNSLCNDNELQIHKLPQPAPSHRGQTCHIGEWALGAAVTLRVRAVYGHVQRVTRGFGFVFSR